MGDFSGNRVFCIENRALLICPRSLQMKSRARILGSFDVTHVMIEFVID